MEKRVIIMNFDVESKAYEAFSKAKRLHMNKAFKGEQWPLSIIQMTANTNLKLKTF